MFSHNGGNGPESKMTRMFRLVRKVAAQGGEVSRLRLHLVRSGVRRVDDGARVATKRSRRVSTSWTRMETAC